MRLARLESLEIKAKGPKIPNSKTAFIDKIEVYLPLKDMIDLGKEKKRMKKEIENKEKFIKSLETKLSNKGFLKKAPVALTQKEKDRLQDEKDNLKKLKEQVKAL